MTKTIKLNDALHAKNSRVTGVSINRDGQIVQVRTRIQIDPQPNRILHCDEVQINQCLRAGLTSQTC